VEVQNLQDFLIETTRLPHLERIWTAL